METTQTEIQKQRLQDKQTLEEMLQIQWKGHAYTQIFKEKLETFQNRMIMEAESLANSSPIDKDAIINRLNASLTIRNILMLVSDKQ